MPWILSGGQITGTDICSYGAAIDDVDGDGKPEQVTLSQQCAQLPVDQWMIAPLTNQINGLHLHLSTGRNFRELQQLKGSGGQPIAVGTVYKSIEGSQVVQGLLQYFGIAIRRNADGTLYFAIDGYLINDKGVFQRDIFSLSPIQAVSGRYIARPGQRLPPKSLNPPKCANAVQWERHELAIEGLSFSIPFYYPKVSTYSWEAYERILRPGFEHLLSYYKAKGLENVLHPGTPNHDMAIYISGTTNAETSILEGCQLGTDGRGGEHHPIRNYIMLAYTTLGFFAYRNSGKQEILLNRISAILYHEMGHATDVHYLRTPEVIAGLQALFDWTWEQVIPDPTERSMARQADWSKGTPVEFVKAHKTPNYKDYLPVHMGASSFDGALTSYVEFVANFFEEYGTYSLVSPSSLPQNAPFKARMETMKQFFSSTGPNPVVFSKENLRRTYTQRNLPF